MTVKLLKELSSVTKRQRKPNNSYVPGFRPVWPSCSLFSHQKIQIKESSVKEFKCWTAEPFTKFVPAALFWATTAVVRLTNALNKWQVLLYPVAKWQQKSPSAEWDHHHHHHPPQWRSYISTNSFCVLVVDVLTGKQHMNIVINSEEFLHSPHESL